MLCEIIQSKGLPMSKHREAMKPALLLLLLQAVILGESAAIYNRDVEHDLDRVKKQVDDSREWTTSEWTECTVSCGGGLRTRSVRCLDEDGVISQDCDSDRRPVSYEFCNQIDCTTLALQVSLLPPSGEYNWVSGDGLSTVLVFDNQGPAGIEVQQNTTEVDGTLSYSRTVVTPSSIQTRTEVRGRNNSIGFRSGGGRTQLVVDREPLLTLNGIQQFDVGGEQELVYRSGVISVDGAPVVPNAVNRLYFFDGFRFYEFNVDKRNSLSGPGKLYVDSLGQTALYSVRGGLNVRIDQLVASLSAVNPTDAPESVATTQVVITVEPVTDGGQVATVSPITAPSTSDPIDDTEAPTDEPEVTTESSKSVTDTREETVPGCVESESRKSVKTRGRPTRRKSHSGSRKRSKSSDDQVSKISCDEPSKSSKERDSKSSKRTSRKCHGCSNDETSTSESSRSIGQSTSSKTSHPQRQPSLRSSHSHGTKTQTSMSSQSNKSGKKRDSKSSKKTSRKCKTSEGCFHDGMESSESGVPSTSSTSSTPSRPQRQPSQHSSHSRSTKMQSSISRESSEETRSMHKTASSRSKRQVKVNTPVRQGVTTSAPQDLDLTTLNFQLTLDAGRIFLSHNGQRLIDATNPTAMSLTDAVLFAFKESTLTITDEVSRETIAQYNDIEELAIFNGTDVTVVQTTGPVGPIKVSNGQLYVSRGRAFLSDNKQFNELLDEQLKRVVPDQAQVMLLFQVLPNGDQLLLVDGNPVLQLNGALVQDIPDRGFIQYANNTISVQDVAGRRLDYPKITQLYVLNGIRPGLQKYTEVVTNEIPGGGRLYVHESTGQAFYSRDGRINNAITEHINSLSRPPPSVVFSIRFEPSDSGVPNVSILANGEQVVKFAPRVVEDHSLSPSQHLVYTNGSVFIVMGDTVRGAVDGIDQLIVFDGAQVIKYRGSAPAIIAGGGQIFVSGNQGFYSVNTELNDEIGEALKAAEEVGIATSLPSTVAPSTAVATSESEETTDPLTTETSSPRSTTDEMDLTTSVRTRPTKSPTREQSTTEQPQRSNTRTPQTKPSSSKPYPSSKHSGHRHGTAKPTQRNKCANTNQKSKNSRNKCNPSRLLSRGQPTASPHPQCRPQHVENHSSRTHTHRSHSHSHSPHTHSHHSHRHTPHTTSTHHPSLARKTPRRRGESTS